MGIASISFYSRQFLNHEIASWRFLNLPNVEKVEPKDIDHGWNKPYETAKTLVDFDIVFEESNHLIAFALFSNVYISKDRDWSYLTEREKTFILAHEAGHIHLEHHKTKWKSIQLSKVLSLAILLFAFKYKSKALLLTSLVSRPIFYLHHQSICRQTEFEADEKAYSIMPLNQEELKRVFIFLLLNGKHLPILGHHNQVIEFHTMSYNAMSFAKKLLNSDPGLPNRYYKLLKKAKPAPTISS